MEKYKGVKLDDYSFFSGLEEDPFNPNNLTYYSPAKSTVFDNLKDGTFNPNNLSLKEQEIYGEVLGVTYDLMHHTPDRKFIIGSLWDERQIDFFGDRLNEGVDFTCRELKDGRYRISIKNPIITHFCRNELPAIGPTMEDSILKGVLTNATLRTVEKDGRKIIHVNKNPVTTGELKHFADLKKLNYSSLDYPVIARPNIHDCYSLWFYAPKEVEDYLIDDFELNDAVEKLPNYNTEEGAWMVLYEQALLRRKKNYDFMKYTGKLEVNGSREKQNEFNRVKNQLRKAGDLLAGGELDEESLKGLKNYHAKIYGELYGKGKNQRTGGDGSDKRRWKNVRGTQV
ncbi:MAG: hypothetical protein DRP06_03105 [Candidatus Aenigmatarchaeota archaeon]|nr:MAG: hypothetical protein DRP06_03105 [Candidatus Aenigmarchaeota archaeon]